MLNPIAISLSPNTSLKDVALALKLLFTPWQWQEGGAIKALEEQFENYFQVRHAVSFNSGRSAEYAILKATGIKKEDEVLIPAFTCVVVPNSVLWLGGKPIYVDFEEDSLNMDPVDLKKKITPKAKAIIAQYTFGKPAKIDQIKKIAEKNKLFLIEDCAHSLGAKFKGKKLGTFGEAAFFSFGRDKVISSVFGGMAITDDPKIGKGLLEIQKRINFPSRFWVFQQLLHPIAFSLIMPVYNFFGLGKIILVGLQKLGLLSRAVSHQEKMTRKPRCYPAKLPNAQATLALFQFQRLAQFNQIRKKISRIYRDKLKIKSLKSLPQIEGEIYMRHPVISDRAKDLLMYAKKRGVLLGDWYQNIVDPQGVDLAKVGYIWGSCPVAESVARKVINLPTYPRITTKEAKRIVAVIEEFFQKKK